MNRMHTLGLLVLGGFLLAGLAANTAQARPQYYKAFTAKYANVTAAKTARCYVCHVKGKSKRQRNNYGSCLAKLLGAKNVKDSAKIDAAFKKAEAADSAIEGKSFGDLLKAGKLPASTD